jgi:hypothetical protein
VALNRNSSDRTGRLNIGYVHYFYAPEHVSPDYEESLSRHCLVVAPSGLFEQFARTSALGAKADTPCNGPVDGSMSTRPSPFSPLRR